MGPRNVEAVSVLATGAGYFRCEALKCTLDQRACALRHSRGSELKKSYPLGIPSDVQTYVVCRDCSVGKSNYTKLRKKGAI